MKTEFHVKHFGAVGDGVADDTAALKAALDAGGAGKTLALGEGVYRCTEALLVPSRTEIVGDGTKSVLAFAWKDQSDGPDFCLGNRNRKNDDAGDTHIYLEDFVVQGGASGKPYGPDNHTVTHGISLRKVEHSTLRHIEVRGVSGFGICQTGIVHSNIVGCYVHDTGRDGITSFGLEAGWRCKWVSVVGCRIENVGDDGIALHAGTAASKDVERVKDCVISGNTIIGRRNWHQNAQGRGICLSGVESVEVEGNRIFCTVSTGILVQGWPDAKPTLRSWEVNLNGNTVIDAGKAVGLDRVKFGVQVKGSSEITIGDSCVVRSRDRGIDIRDSSVVIVEDCTVYGCGGRAGILVAEDASACDLRRNVIRHVRPILAHDGVVQEANIVLET